MSATGQTGATSGESFIFFLVHSFFRSFINSTSQSPIALIYLGGRIGEIGAARATSFFEKTKIDVSQNFQGGVTFKSGSEWAQ